MDKEQIRKEWGAGLLKAPSVNIVELDDDYLLTALMPGVTKQGVEVKLTDDALTIYGRVEKSGGQASHIILNEIDEGNFYRVFKVGDAIDTEKISAKIEDGVLNLTLPKHERIKPREIPIEVM